MKKIFAWFMALAVVVALAIGGWWLFRPKDPDPAPSRPCYCGCGVCYENYCECDTQGGVECPLMISRALEVYDLIDALSGITTVQDITDQARLDIAEARRRFNELNTRQRDFVLNIGILYTAEGLVAEVDMEISRLAEIDRINELIDVLYRIDDYHTLRNQIATIRGYINTWNNVNSQFPLDNINTGEIDTQEARADLLEQQAIANAAMRDEVNRINLLIGALVDMPDDYVAIRAEIAIIETEISAWTGVALVGIHQHIIDEQNARADLLEQQAIDRGLMEVERDRINDYIVVMHLITDYQDLRDEITRLRGYITTWNSTQGNMTLEGVLTGHIDTEEQRANEMAAEAARQAAMVAERERINGLIDGLGAITVFQTLRNQLDAIAGYIATWNAVDTNVPLTGINDAEILVQEARASDLQHEETMTAAMHDERDRINGLIDGLAGMPDDYTAIRGQITWIQGQIAEWNTANPLFQLTGINTGEIDAQTTRANNLEAGQAAVAAMQAEVVAINAMIDALATPNLGSGVAGAQAGLVQFDADILAIDTRIGNWTGVTLVGVDNTTLNWQRVDGRNQIRIEIVGRMIDIFAGQTIAETHRTSIENADAAYQLLAPDLRAQVRGREDLASALVALVRLPVANIYGRLTTQFAWFQNDFDWTAATVDAARFNTLYNLMNEFNGLLQEYQDMLNDPEHLIHGLPGLFINNIVFQVADVFITDLQRDATVAVSVMVNNLPFFVTIADATDVQNARDAFAALSNVQRVYIQSVGQWLGQLEALIALQQSNAVVATFMNDIRTEWESSSVRIAQNVITDLQDRLDVLIGQGVFNEAVQPIVEGIVQFLYDELLRHTGPHSEAYDFVELVVSKGLMVMEDGVWVGVDLQGKNLTQLNALAADHLIVADKLQDLLDKNMGEHMPMYEYMDRRFPGMMWRLSDAEMTIQSMIEEMVWLEHLPEFRSRLNALPNNLRPGGVFTNIAQRVAIFNQVLDMLSFGADYGIIQVDEGYISTFRPSLGEDMDRITLLFGAERNVYQLFTPDVMAWFGWLVPAPGQVDAIDSTNRAIAEAFLTFVDGLEGLKWHIVENEPIGLNFSRDVWNIRVALAQSEPSWANNLTEVLGYLPTFNTRIAAIDAKILALGLPADLNQSDTWWENFFTTNPNFGDDYQAILLAINLLVMDIFEAKTGQPFDPENADDAAWDMLFELLETYMMYIESLGALLAVEHLLDLDDMLGDDR